MKVSLSVIMMVLHYREWEATQNEQPSATIIGAHFMNGLEYVSPDSEQPWDLQVLIDRQKGPIIVKQ